MATRRPVGEKEAIFGYDHPIHVVTIDGTATSGSFYLAEPGQSGNLTTSIAYGASAATVQTAVRTVAIWSQATVSGSSGGPWTITLNSSRATYGPLDVINNTIEASSGAINVTVTATAVPLRYWIEQPTRTVSVAPYAGRTVIAGGDEAAQRGDQVKATEFVQTGPLYLGRRTLREQEDAARIWDSNATTHTSGGITAPIGHASVAYSSGTTFVAWELSYDDMYGIDTSGVVYRVRRGIPGGHSFTSKGTISSPIGYGGCTRFRGTAFFPGGTSTQQYAYVTSADAYTAVTGGSSNLFSTSPFVDFEALGDRLFAVTVSGQLGYTTSGTPAFTDWDTPATLVYRGKGNVLQLVRWKNPATGNEAIILLATDGVYLVDHVAGVVQLLGDLALPVGVPSDDANLPYTSQVAGVKDGNLIFLSNNTVLSYNGATVTDLGPYAGQGLPTNSRTFDRPFLLTCLLTTQKFILVSACAFTTSSDGSPRPDGGTHILMGYTDGWVTMGTDTLNTGRSLAYTGSQADTQLFLDQCAMFFNDATGEPETALRGLYVADTGDLITSWFDRGMPDVDKVFWGGTIDARDVTGSETFTVYYELDFAPDNPSSVAGSGDPRRNWKQCLDKDGNAFVLNATLLKGARGQARFYYDRFTAADGTTKYSRGVVGRAIRHRIVIAAGASSLGSGTVLDGTTTVTNSGGIFKPTDAGKLIYVHSSGTVITPSRKSVITAYTSPTTVTVADALASVFGGFTWVWRYAVLEAISVISDAKFDRVKRAPVAFNLRGPDSVAPDGRTPKRQCDDLEAALDYKQGLPFATAYGIPMMTTLEHLDLPDPAILATDTKIVATGSVSERVPTR